MQRTRQTPAGRLTMSSACVPLPYARFNEIRFEELVGLIPPLSYSLPRGDDLCSWKVRVRLSRHPGVRVNVRQITRILAPR